MTAISLRTLSSEPLEVEVDHLQLLDDDARVLVRVLLTWGAWGRVHGEGLFHLDGEPEPPGFEAGEQVSLLLRLRDAVEAPPNLEALGEALARPESPLNHTEAWLATEVMQAVDAPEGEAELGHRTRWAAPIVSPGEFTASAASLRRLVEGFLTEQGFEVTANSPELLSFRADLDDVRQWAVLVRLDAKANACVFFSVHPDEVPASKRPQVALALAATNYRLGLGAFEMDVEDGEVRYRTEVPRPSEEVLGEALRVNLSQMAQMFGVIRSATL